MLIRFTDDYDNYIHEALALVGRITSFIANKEVFVGDTNELDKLYALSTAISGIVDHLANDDNSEPKYNEFLLETLKSLLSKNICNTNSNIPKPIPNLLPEPVDLNNFAPKSTNLLAQNNLIF